MKGTMKQFVYIYKERERKGKLDATKREKGKNTQRTDVVF